MSVSAPAVGEQVIDGYRSRTAGGVRPDEVLDGHGRVHAGQESVASALDALGPVGLRAAVAETRRLVREEGIQYGAAGEDQVERAWSLDPVPVVLGAHEWAFLERGLEQRAILLDLVLADLYGPRRLLADGSLPADLVVGHPGFVPRADGLPARGERRLVVASADLGRDSAGAWTVIGDRTAAPSGAGYAMANRRITSRVMAGLHRQTPLARLRGFFHVMTESLASLAPEGSGTRRVVVLSPGSASETAFEQAFLATLMGFPLVEADDLSVRGGRVWLRAGERLQPVDVVLRRVDSSYCDPLELRADSQLGVPGLLEAARRGTVGVANPLGSRVLENPGLLAYLPALARRLLGEDLAVPTVATWWCGDPVQRSHVLAHLDELVVKPISRELGPYRFPHEDGALSGPDLRSRIEDAPWSWCAQEPLPLSTAPVVTEAGLEPRRMVLRTFAVSSAERYRFLPGGLARVASTTEASWITNTAGALSKDVWVLDTGGESETAALRLGTPPAFVPQHARRGLAPRVADSLFWLGRYTERAESGARLLRVTADLVEDHQGRPQSAGGGAMTAMVRVVEQLTGTDLGPAPEAEALRGVLVDGTRPGTVAFAVHRMVACAREVRDVLSADIWPVLDRLDRGLQEAADDDGVILARLDDVLESTLAVAGVVAESMVRDDSWGFLDAGARVERAQHTLGLLRQTLTVDLPPVTEGQVAEAVLVAGESGITHRRRAAAGEGPAWPVHSALTLLLLDPGNPRSVAFGLARLAEGLAIVGDDTARDQSRGLLDRLVAADVLERCEGDRHGLRTLLDALRAGTVDISDGLTTRHFRRKPPRVAQATEWVSGSRRV